jgi:hypothetical protein
MCADDGTGSFRHLNGAFHGDGITRMEATCNVGSGDTWNEFAVVSHDPIAKTLPAIAVDVDMLHGLRISFAVIADAARLIPIRSIIKTLDSKNKDAYILF